jgi:hypothetical protein
MSQWQHRHRRFPNTGTETSLFCYRSLRKDDRQGRIMWHRLGKVTHKTAQALLWVTWLLSLCGCATIDDEVQSVITMPARSTSESEIAAVIATSIKEYPICTRVFALRLVGKPVDFHEAIEKNFRHQDSEAVLDVLVRAGYLTKVPRLDLGWRVIEYQRTERSQSHDVMSYGRLCVPAERKLIAVTAVERVAKASFEHSGHLLIRFTHALDPASIWAKETDLVQLMDGRSPDVTPLSNPRVFDGEAELYRVWIRGKHPLKGAPHNGELHAIKYDGVHYGYVNGTYLGIPFTSSGD